MKLLLYILILAAIILLYLVVRFLIKRLVLISKLRKFAKENNYSCKITSPLFFLPFNRREKGAVLIETESTVYNIKAFGLLRRHCEVHFWNSREYSVKQYHRLQFFGNRPIGQQKCHRRKIGGFDYNDIKNYADYKLVVPILLLSPTNTLWSLTKMQDNKIFELKAGEKIDNILFADTPYLLWYITDREKRDY